jgi:hypothetical protein
LLYAGWWMVGATIKGAGGSLVLNCTVAVINCRYGQWQIYLQCFPGQWLEGLTENVGW